MPTEKFVHGFLRSEEFVVQDLCCERVDVTEEEKYFGRDRKIVFSYVRYSSSDVLVSIHFSI